MTLIEKLRQNRPVLLYGLTPPRLSKSPEEVRQIAARQLARLANARFDGLVIYDLQDESDRASERPFEFSGCYAPERYWREFLGAPCDAVIYKAISQLRTAELADFMSAVAPNAAVFVGAASSKPPSKPHSRRHTSSNAR